MELCCKICFFSHVAHLVGPSGLFHCLQQRQAIQTIPPAKPWLELRRGDHLPAQTSPNFTEVQKLLVKDWKGTLKRASHNRKLQYLVKDNYRIHFKPILQIPAISSLRRNLAGFPQFVWHWLMRLLRHLLEENNLLDLLLKFNFHLTVLMQPANTLDSAMTVQQGEVTGWTKNCIKLFSQQTYCELL